MVLSVICIKFLLKGFLLKVQLESPDSWGVHSMIKAFVLCSARDSQLCTITTQSHSSKGAHTLHKSDIDTSCCFYRKSSSSSSLLLLLLLLLQFQSLLVTTLLLRFREMPDHQKWMTFQGQMVPIHYLYLRIVLSNEDLSQAFLYFLPHSKKFLRI